MPIASAEFGGGAGIAEIIESLKQEAVARHDRAKDAFQTFCPQEAIAMSATPRQAAVSAEWLVETGDITHWLAVHGRVADLLVLGRPPHDGAMAMDVLKSALMETGRPVLIVPARPAERIGQTVAIAWKDTAEAASAVAAAMPLLAIARRVIILAVNEDARTDTAACERLRQALVWHNRSTTVQCMPIADAEPADTLLKVAVENGADLMVMGGYGHNRLREVVYGGVTGRVLQAFDLPVLMAR
jgi:nucleotide-binding universal stress UspA family protein